MRTFEQKLSKKQNQCKACGLSEDHCLCSEHIEIESLAEFWLLTHINELGRTNNTGRLIENALKTTRVFKWERTQPPEELIKLIQSNLYEIYIVFSDERPSEKQRSTVYQKSSKKTVFLILDGTWKEARKMLRKSPYLDALPILPIHPIEMTRYDLRRNPDEHHICTVEVAIHLLKAIGETRESKLLEAYFMTFLLKYHDGKYDHEV